MKRFGRASVAGAAFERICLHEWCDDAGRPVVVQVSSSPHSVGKGRVRITAYLGSADPVVRVYTVLPGRALRWAGRASAVELEACRVDETESVILSGVIAEDRSQSGYSDSSGTNLVAADPYLVETTPVVLGQLQPEATDVEVSAGPVVGGATFKVLLRRRTEGASSAVWCDTGKELVATDAIGAQAVLPGVAPGHWDAVGLQASAGSHEVAVEVWEIVPWE